MALDPVVLDDLTWNDFSTAALLRIPAASAGLWTLNAPVDPGITLLDLFGWLLEQRVYWMDQVSDPLTQALFNLMGIKPNPAVAATTVLHVRASSTAVTLTKGALAWLAKSLDPPVFTTNETINVYPFATTTGSGRFKVPQVDLMVGTNQSRVALAQGRSPALLDPNGGATTITLTLDSSAPALDAGTLSLFFDMLTPPGLDPGWSPLSAPQPAGPNPLTWQVSINNGTATALTNVQDGTNGLRRPGIVLLPIPAIPAPQPNTSSTCAVILSASAAGWATPPRVTRLIPNVVSAVHSRPATEMTPDYIEGQVNVWRRLPGNVIVLPETARPALPPITVTITEAGQTAATPWTPVDDLGICGPADPFFVYDAVSARLRFGDGVAGKLPIPKDPTSVTVSYNVGGGTAGNLASGLQWTLDNPNAGPLEAWNVVPAAGGADAETLDQVRQRAPEVLKSTGRAITAADFEEIATQTPGTSVARAVCGSR